MLALLAAGCATTSSGIRTTEVDDVYFSSRDRILPSYAPAMAATAAPAADGSVANPDYTGQQPAANQDYYDGGAYTAAPRVTSPYYGSFNGYNSGFAYDPFWAGSSLAVGCMPGWGWGGGPMFGYAPMWGGPRVRFGVSFGYGWGGWNSWAAPMYGWAGPTFYDPFWDPFWGPSYGYGAGWGYPMYGWGSGWGWGGGGWRNGYRNGFYDGFYAGGGSWGGIRNGRRVTYGPRLDRSGDRTTGGYVTNGRGGRTTRADDGGRTIGPGATNGGGYQPAAYGGYGGGISRANGAVRSGGAAYSGTSGGYAAPNAAPTGRISRSAREWVPAGQPQQPMGQPSYSQPKSLQQQVYQPTPQQATEGRQGGWLQRAARSMGETRSEAPSRSYSPPVQRSSPSSSYGGGGYRSSGGGGGSYGGGGGGGSRRSR